MLITMRNLLIFCLLLLNSFNHLSAQTPLTEAIDFSVKTTESEVINLFPLLDAGNIVVIDFFSTSCGPCQTFAYDFEMAYQNFGSNQGNVFFLAINYNSDNQGVRIFDSTFNVTLPSASGIEGGGNAVYEAYLISAYPTVIVIKPDHQIAEQFIWEPTAENITNAVVNAGGTLVGEMESKMNKNEIVISPNPANDVLKLSFNANCSQTIAFRVYDLTGKVFVLKKNIAISDGPSHVDINISQLSAGVYFIEAVQDDGKTLTEKFIVK